jgi:hypothetical protein
MPKDLDLKRMIHENRAKVKARGHDWDVADVLEVIETYLSLVEKEHQ